MQEYKLLQFEIGDFKDPNGNTWCTAVFEGEGEPVKWVVKQPEKIVEGQSYYGEIVSKESKAGKPYQRFYKKQKPEGGYSGYSPSPKKEWQPRDDDRIVAQWAVGQSVALFGPRMDKLVDMAAIERHAVELFHMVGRVKSSTQDTAPQVAAVTESDEPEVNSWDQDIINMFPDNLPDIPVVQDDKPIEGGNYAASPALKRTISGLLLTKGIKKENQSEYLALEMGVDPRSMTDIQAKELINKIRQMEVIHA